MKKLPFFFLICFAIIHNATAVNWGQYPTTNAPGLNDTFLIGVFSGTGTNMQLSAGNLRTWVLSADTTSIQASGSASVGQALVVTGTDGQGRLTVKGTNWPSGTAGALVAANNLSDVASATTALQNIGGNNAGNLSAGTVAAARLGSGATSANFLRGDSTFQTVLIPGNNLSDVLNAATARANLGADNAGNLNSGTVASARLGTGGLGLGARFLADDQTFKPITGGGDMLKSDNLSGLANNTTARANIGANDAGNLNAGTLSLSRLTADVMRTNATFVPGSLLYTSATDQLVATNVGAGAITNDGNGNFGAASLRDSTSLANNSFAYADGTGKIVSGYDASTLTNILNGNTVSVTGGGASLALTKNANGSTNFGITVTGGGGGFNALGITNVLVTNNVTYVLDLSVVQSGTFQILTNCSVVFTNIGYLTNYHDESALFHFWQGTNGGARATMSVAGGLLRTNSANLMGTNASEMDSIIVRYGPTGTNLLEEWRTNWLPTISYTNAIGGGGGGGGGGGSFVYTFITNVQVSASANGVVTSSAVDCRDANLSVVTVVYLGGTVKTNSANGGVGTSLDKSTSNFYWPSTIYHNAGNNVFCQQFYCTNGTYDSTMTWTVEVDGGTGYPTMMVALYKKTVSGVAAIPIFDQQTGLNGVDGSSATWTIPALTPSTDGELSVAAMMLGSVFSHNVTGVASGGNTYIPITNNNGSGLFYFIQGTAASLSPVFTWSGAEPNAAGANMLWK